MTNKEKAQMIQDVIDHPGRERTYYSLLEDMGDLKVSGDGLYHILYEFRTVAFQAFPLFSSSDTFIGHRFTTEFVLANTWFDVFEFSAGWKSDE